MIIRPSKLDQVAACPGSSRVPKELSKPGPEAEEGTMLHEILATDGAVQDL